MSEMSNEELVAMYQAGDESALEKLFLQNKPLIWRFANSIARGVPVDPDGLTEDLTQESFFGLKTAAEKYDPDMDVKFFTYASHWIRMSMFRYIHGSLDRIRIPEHVHERLPEYLQFINEYHDQHGSYPDRKIIAQALHILPATVEIIENYCNARNGRSLDEPLSEDPKDGVLGDMIPDNSILVDEEVTNEALKNSIHDQLWRIVNQLKPELKTAVIKNVMLQIPMSKIASDEGVTHQRIAERKNMAIKEIRHNKLFKRLAADCFDLYGIATRSSGLSTFKRTGTSSTERAAIRAIYHHEQKNLKLLDNLHLSHDFTTSDLKQALQTVSREEAESIINNLVGDPDQATAVTGYLLDRRISDIRIMTDGLIALHQNMDHMLHRIKNKTGDGTV